MSYSAISSAIAAIVDAATDVANVYAVPEWAVDQGTIDSKFASTVSSVSLLQAWWIWRSSLDEFYGPNGQMGIPDHTSFSISTYVITGYLRHSEDNNSESQFHSMVDNVLISLRSKMTLSSSVEQVLTTRVEFDPGIVSHFGAMGAHRVMITLTVRERNSISGYS